MNPNIKVYGAEPKNADDTYRSILNNKIMSNETTNTIADGLRAQVGSITFPIIQENVDSILLVSEKMIINSMYMIWQRLKIIIEPSCSIVLAALLLNSKKFINKKVGLILTDDTFVVLCGDALIDLALTEAVRRHREKGALASLITKPVPSEHVW